MRILIFGIKTPAKCAKVNASKRKTKRIEKELFNFLGKTPTKQPKNWVETQRKAPAKQPKNLDIFDKPLWKIPA